MKMAIWIIVFSICIVENSWATANCPQGTTLNVDCWSCGDDCMAYLSSDTINQNGNKQLNITGSGDMYDTQGNAPWNSKRNQITNIVVGNGITSIGNLSLIYTQAQSVSLPDTLTSIGDLSFYGGPSGQYPLSNINIPDSVTSIGGSTFEGTSFTSLVIPESVTYIGTRAFRNIPLEYLVIEGILSSNTPGRGGEGLFGYMNSNVIVYCRYNAHCENKGASVEIKMYDKDKNGVYFLTDINGNPIGDSFWATPDNMGKGGNFSCKDYESCVADALDYKNNKAKIMAQNGVLCQTTTGCLKLIDMAATDENCTTIAECIAYGKANGILFNDPNMIKNTDGSYTLYDENGNIISYRGKRIYTVKEATYLTQQNHGKNTFTLKYR